MVMTTDYLAPSSRSSVFCWTYSELSGHSAPCFETLPVEGGDRVLRHSEQPPNPMERKLTPLDETANRLRRDLKLLGRLFDGKSLDRLCAGL